MSESYLHIIPTDPQWIPDDADAAAARRALGDVCPDAGEVTAERGDEIGFVDQGGNFIAIRCPHCHEEMPVQWWQGEMSRAYERNFTDLVLVTPCYAERSSLNDLDYDWPAGFARFVLAARSPGRGWLTPDELAHVTAALRHPVRQILTRY